MSTTRSTRNPDVQEIDPMPQDETRCRILGIDENGREHIHDTDRDKIVVIDESGISVQYDLSVIDKDAGDWMRYVDGKIGWAKEQWLGHRWKRALENAFTN